MCPAVQHHQPPLDGNAAHGYQLRITLREIEPPIWRSIQVPASITLPDLHDVLQVVFGWEDYHLHRFTVGDNPWDSSQVSFVEQNELDEGFLDDPDENKLETEVRLADLLTTPGDTVLYLYDYGDSWEHLVTLEARTASTDTVCLEGARACPPEDCGGPHGYAELLKTLADPAHPEYDHMRSWAGTFKAEHFDIEVVNKQLQDVLRRNSVLRTAAGSSPLVAEILSRVHPDAVPLLVSALESAHLEQSVEIDTADRAAALAKFTWMIDHVGDKLKLTAAGYLPPKTVAQMRRELNWNAWSFIGGNRESDHFQATLLRESMVKLGLVRKIKGELLPTARAAKLRNDPQKLWDHVATRMPRGNDDAEKEAGVIALIAAAAGIHDADPLVLETMPALRWQADHPRAFTYAAAETQRFLFLIGMPSFSTWTTHDVPPWIAAFARSVLRNDGRL